LVGWLVGWLAGWLVTEEYCGKTARGMLLLLGVLRFISASATLC